MFTSKPTLSIFTSQASANQMHMKGMSEELTKKNNTLTSKNANESYLDTPDLLTMLESEETLMKLHRQEKDDSFLMSRFNRMSQQIEDVGKVAQELLTLINTVGGNGINQTGFTDAIKGHLDQIQRIMNDGFNGNQTFAGISIKTDAVCDLGKMPEITETDDMYAYYKGADGNIDINVDRQTRINAYPITGKHDAFAKTIQAARLCLTIDPKDATAPTFTRAKQLITDATSYEFSKATNKLNVEKSKLKFTIDNIPRQIAIESDRYSKANAENIMDTIVAVSTLMDSIDVNNKTAVNVSMFNRNINKTITDTF